MEPLNFPSNAQSGAPSLIQTYMQRVYQWMAAGLALTGFVAYWTSGNLGLVKALYGGLFFPVLLVELGLVFWLSSQAQKISAKAAVIGFSIYSALNGMTLSYIFLVYAQSSIATVFLMTAATFAGVSLYGWTLKRDLGSMGSFFAMALIGIIVTSLINIFLKSPALEWVISYAGVALFIALTAYDTQKLKAIHQNYPDAPEQMAVLGALTLYLDFINMFLFLLRIFGRRK
ncbi:MAG TPA: Bax inhibitor-1/YccA family protein [Verrucomicrobiae bacterium]|jgi:FtsH-binding integral membrane protein|nr:Bax inhibitor-1/YccA family protein [Verrucomicrobiae bacterium]